MKGLAYTNYRGLDPSSPQKQRACRPLKDMVVETSHDVGTSDVATFRYCTTCKRFMECKRFSPTRKTCSTCLLKGRERARKRCTSYSSYATLHRHQIHETLTKLKAGGRVTCSSCKVAKALFSFETNRKTCKLCLEKRRIRRTRSRDMIEEWVKSNPRIPGASD